MNKIDLIIEEYIDNELNISYELNENILNNVKDLIERKKEKTISICKEYFNQFVNAVEKSDEQNKIFDIINKTLKYLKTNKTINNINDLKSLGKVQVNESSIGADREKGSVMTWLKTITLQGAISAQIFTSFKIFSEVNNLFTIGEFDSKKLLIYSLIWIWIATKAYRVAKSMK